MSHTSLQELNTAAKGAPEAEFIRAFLGYVNGVDSTVAVESAVKAVLAVRVKFLGISMDSVPGTKEI